MVNRGQRAFHQAGNWNIRRNEAPCAYVDAQVWLIGVRWEREKVERRGQGGETAEAVRATRATSEKSRIVAEYLRSLDASALPVAAVFLSGRPFPERDQRKIGLGWRAISTVVQSVAGADDEAMRRAYDRSSDVGTAVGELLAEAGHAPEAGPLGLVETAEAIGAIKSHRNAMEDLLVRAATHPP